jgi:ribosomal protein S18 acetylase RimI-like enzyme
MFIRQATAEDAATLSALNADAQKLHADAIPFFFKQPSAETFPPSHVLDRLENPNNRFYLACEDDEVVGYLLLEIRHRPEDNMRHAFDSVYIHQIAIRPGYQGRGYGQQLIEHAKNVTRELGVRYLLLDTWAFNSKAQQFFTSQGFTPFKINYWMEL